MHTPTPSHDDGPLPLIPRAIRCIRTKGLSGTRDTLLSIVEDRWFEARYGLDTTSEVTLDRLVIQSPSKDEGEGYGATRKRHFRKLLEHLRPPEGSVFVDVGSGKGRILLVASLFPFKRIVGIDFSSQLCAIARMNVARFQGRAGGVTPIEIHEGDATHYHFAGDENIVYLCNPFHGSVMKTLLRNLRESVRSHPRKLWLVYTNPADARLIEEDGLFDKPRLFSYGGCHFYIYETPAPRLTGAQGHWSI